MFQVDVEDTCRGIRSIDMAPNPPPQNPAPVETGNGFRVRTTSGGMLSRARSLP